VSFPDVWLKLVRDGDTITGQGSQDGQRWKTFCVHRQRLPPAACLGLAVTSHSADQTVKVVFSHLVFRGEVR
jgi:regulation of enolase protein 1 (concanavalin A-like superfamily)